jgi:hypothetical protein
MSSPAAIATHELHFPHGSGVGSFEFWQFSALARIRAVLVFPVPRVPQKR